MPIWANITQDTGITVTNAANTITIKNILPFTSLGTDVDGPAVPTAGKIDITGDGVFTQTQAMGVPLDIIEVQLVCPGATKGQIPIANATTGIPVWASLTGSAGIVITENDGTVDISGGGGGGGGLVGIRTDDTNIAILDVGNRINVYGDGIIASSSAASTVTLQLEGSADGQLLVGNTATGFPIWAPLTTDVSTSITITPGANTLQISTTSPRFEGLLSETPSTAVPDAVAHKIAMTGDAQFLFTSTPNANTLQTKFLGGTDGMIPIAKTGGVPLWKTLTEGANITITNAANSITIAASGGGGGGLVALDGDIGTANLSGASKIKLHGLDLITTDAGTTASQVNIGLTRPGVAGQIPISHAAGAPLWASLTQGPHITITPANNAITITGESGFDGLISDGPDDADALNNRVTVAGDLAFITTDAAVINTLTVNFTCPAATSGQIPIANAVSGIPVWASIGHSDNTITVTEGAGTLDLKVTDAFKGILDNAAATVAADAGTKLIKVVGDTLLTKTTKTAADTLTISLTGGVDLQVIGGVTATGIPIWKTLTSIDGSVAFDTLSVPGTINLKAAGGGGAGATLFVTPAGNGIVYAGQFKINDGINTNAKIYTIAQPSDTLIIDLNNVIYWANTNAGGTTGMIYLGGNRFLHNYGVQNTFYGQNAGNLTLTAGAAANNTGIGANVLDALTTGYNNTCAGSQSGSSITTAALNSFYGMNAGAATTIGNSNVAIGGNALASNVSGEYNVAIGAYTLDGSTTMHNAVAIGFQALSSTGGGTAVGAQALTLSTGTGNTALGFSAGSGVTTGTNNTFLGHDTGRVVTGSENVYIGAGVNPTAAGTQSYSTYIGYGCDGTGSSNIAIQADTGHAPSALSHTIKIGTQGAGNGQQNTCYVAGIYGSTVGATNAAVYVDSTGKLGTGSATYQPAFLAVQTSSVSNVTGDDSVYWLGSSAIMNDTPATGYDLGNNFYPGSGAGAPCYFTAPFKGLYYLEITTLITGIYTVAPLPPPPVVLPSTPLTITTYNAGGAAYRTYNLWYPVITYQGTGFPYKSSQTITYSVICFMDVNYTAKFSVSLYYLSGTKALGVGASSGSNIDTFVCGNIISPIV